MRNIFKIVAFGAAMFGASSALAASALVTTDLNLRTGPGSNYRQITAMPEGSIVDVRGCTRGYDWCRVNWRGYDGWASSRYLAQETGQYRGRAYSGYGAQIGIPLVAGVIIGNALSRDDDWDRRRPRYRDRDWRHDRDWRRDGRDWRNERRRDVRRDRRDDRREARRDRRDDVREWLDEGEFRDGRRFIPPYNAPGRQGLDRFQSGR